MQEPAEQLTAGFGSHLAGRERDMLKHLIKPIP